LSLSSALLAFLLAVFAVKPVQAHTETVLYNRLIFNEIERLETQFLARIQTAGRLSLLDELRIARYYLVTVNGIATTLPAVALVPLVLSDDGFSLF
jgi:hypothetical protein